MAIVSMASTPPLLLLPRKPISLSHSLSFIPHDLSRPAPRALKTAPGGGKIGAREVYGTDLGVEAKVSLMKDEEVGVREGISEGEKGKEGDKRVNWEDQILEDTVPLVGFVRMILHSNKYRSGERLAPDHEKIIMERLLPYHPNYETKMGCGIDYITVGYHPDFESTRCLFVARKDGELIDFSYWKCIKGLIRKNYPLYADSFIHKHFGRHRRSE